MRDAVLDAWPVLPAMLVALRLGHSAVWIATLGAGLFVAAVVLRWRGQDLGRGVAPGFMAGIAPLIIPSLTIDCVSACSADCAAGFGGWCRASCVVAGVVAGAFVGYKAAYVGPGWMRFLASGLVIAAATGAMGCLLGGAIGVGGMLLGFAVGVIPVVTLLPRTA